MTKKAKVTLIIWIAMVVFTLSVYAIAYYRGQQKAKGTASEAFMELLEDELRHNPLPSLERDLAEMELRNNTPLPSDK